MPSSTGPSSTRPSRTATAPGSAAFLRTWRGVVPLGLTLGLALTLLPATPASAAPGDPYEVVQAGFTTDVFGTAPASLGGVAFAPDGDVWASECNGSGTRLFRFDRQGTPTTVHGTPVRLGAAVATAGGCGLATHPGGSVFVNTSAGLAFLHPHTGAQLALVGRPGNGLGVAVDPRTGALVYGGANCAFPSPVCTIERYDPTTGRSDAFATLPAGAVTVVDGLAFDATGDHLLLATRVPGFRLTVLDRAGQVVQTVILDGEPIGVAVHASNPVFVVTDETGGTMTRLDFPGGDLTRSPLKTAFASGGLRGGHAAVGPDRCLYLIQDGTRYRDGSVGGENSVVRVCGGFGAAEPAPSGPVALWADTTGDALQVTGTNLDIRGTIHSNGKAVVAGQRIAIDGPLRFASSAQVSGRNVQITRGTVRVPPGTSPVRVDVAGWRPGGASAVALGTGWSAAPAGACRTGTWRPVPGLLRGLVVHVPCKVVLDGSGPVRTAIVAEGQIQVRGRGLHLSTGVGFSLASAAGVDVDGRNVEIAGSVWAAGTAHVGGQNVRFGCGIFAGKVSIAARRVRVASCPR